MLLIIDNYDSFTFNLVQYLGEVGVGAGDMTVLRNDEKSADEIAAMRPDRVVISPGPCTPNEAGVSVDVVKRLGARVPLLGVCLGHQSIGQAYGGKVIRAPKVMHGKTSRIAHTGDALFRGIGSPFEATRYHSLIVDRESLPECLEITAEADGLIMAMRHREHPVWGVQFHPESIKTEVGRDILRNFLEMGK